MKIIKNGSVPFNPGNKRKCQMNKSLFLMTLFLAFFAWEATASMDFEKDIITTSKGDLEITFMPSCP